MSKFKVGDKVVSLVTVNLLRKGQVYVVTYVSPQGKFYHVDDGIMANEKSIQHATRLHKFLVGVK